MQRALTELLKQAAGAAVAMALAAALGYSIGWLADLFAERGAGAR